MRRTAQPSRTQLIVFFIGLVIMFGYGPMTHHHNQSAAASTQPTDVSPSAPETEAPPSELATGTPTTVVGNPFDVTDEAADAFDACKNFVTEDLKAPAGATWRDPFGDQVTYLNDGSPQWVVMASVDAENSFGAKLRTDYACTVTDQGGSWHLDNLNDS